MSYGRIHTTTQRSLPTNQHLTSSSQPPGRSSTQTSPAPMSPTASTQRRSAVPQPTTVAEATRSSPPGDTNSGRSNHAGPALTTFRNLRGAGVSGGFFVNTTGPVSLYNDRDPSRPPPDNHDYSSRITTPTPSPSQNAEYDVYYNHLLVKGRGTPLWEPGPQMTFPNEYRRNGVSIGDVGILYRNGDFAFLFNIFLPADHDINIGRVPNGFIPLDKSKIEKTIKKSIFYDRGSCVASSSLRQTDSSDFAFQTTGGEGAVLVMPDGALSEDLRHYKLVEKYIADNAKNWYEYVESDDCGMPTENGDIRVVVGMDKVSSWGMATFENVDVEQPLQFEFKDDGRGSHSRTYKWDRIITGRAGPPEEEIRDLLQGPDTSPLRNQCVFVRTLNVSVAGKVRDELAVYEVRASCFRDNFSEFQSRRQTRPGHRNANIQSPQMGQPVSHPSKFLNKYLLEKCPNAKVVITKDLDWMSVITENEAPNPNFEDICARVLASHTICENEGVVTLKKRKTIFRTGSMPDPSAVHQQTTSEDVLPMGDQETYITGRLFLKAPVHAPKTWPPGLSNTLEKPYYDNCPQIGESESSLHLPAPCFDELNTSDVDYGGSNLHYAENPPDKGARTSPDESLCPEEPLNSKDCEPSPSRTTQTNHFDYNGPELEASTGPEAANNRNPKFTQQQRQPGFAHLQQKSATKVSHSSFVAAEQEQNLVIQEKSSTDIWLEFSKLSKESFCSKETWTIFPQPEGMLFFSLILIDFIHYCRMLMGLKWIDPGNLCVVLGFLQMFEAVDTTFSTLEIVLYTFIGVWATKGISSTRITATMLASIWISSGMLASVVLLTTNNRWRHNMMDLTHYWCPNPGWKLFSEYFWLWITLLPSLLLYVSLSLWQRGWFARDNSDSNRRRGQWVMLAYPALHFVVILPLSISRWIISARNVYHMLSASTLALDAFCGCIGFFNIVILLMAWDRYRDERLRDTCKPGKSPSRTNSDSFNM